jgi:hypothetical protein
MVTMRDREWKGIIIAEGLSDPTVINNFTVYKVWISEYGKPIDYKGNIGRWDGYYVKCSRKEINELQSFILKGWYAHFWKNDKLLIVYNDKQFEVDRNDKSTWKEAIRHGKKQGIPENELDFPTG